MPSNKVPKVTPAKLDQAGRTTQDASYQYSYNIWGKLDAVKANTNQSKETVATYQSNALGERVMASYPTAEGKQTRYYLYDKQKRIAELDENGHVIQQFLYLNESPIAVINSPTVSSETNQEGIVAIHTDRRHAPMMATDEQGNVVWQAEYDAWGKLIHANHQQNDGEQSGQFTMHLRLPGQWQDRATGLYYNYQRDYNPDSGRYLTPDPLGFPDGPDAYAYVGNDPLNKVDPLGLYQSDIHYYMTLFLAVAAGVDKDEARIIALAAQYIDDNDDTKPLNIGSGHSNRLLTYHITQSGHDDERKKTEYYPTPQERAYAINSGYPDPGPGPIINYLEDEKTYAERRFINPDNPQLRRLLAAAGKAPTRCSKLQFFGEYLHTFQDTFAHRDSNNKPIPLNLGAGHGAYGSHPDYTYNHKSFLTPRPGSFNWDYNEARTLEMELEVFAKMTQFSSGDDVISSGKISKGDFEELLSNFNELNEHENNGYEKANPGSSAKIQLLQARLNEWFGDGVIDLENEYAYSVDQGASNRNDYLCSNGQPLSQSDFEGTILPASCQ